MTPQSFGFSIRPRSQANPALAAPAISPIQRYQDDNQFVYNLTTLFDKHYLKTGTDIRRQKLDDLADNFSVASITAQPPLVTGSIM